MEAVLILLLLPRAGFAQATGSTLKTGPPPAWVKWEVPEAKDATRSDQATGGQVYTLLDTQVNTANAESFTHIVKEIASEAGVQSGANLEFAWDPSYQELIIHQITIQRGTERMDRLDPAKFKIIQQENDLSRQIYNGNLSAVLFLEDVRMGDRVEYAYSLRGENPSLKGRYSDTFTLGFGVPVQRRRIRLLWPEQHQLNFRIHGTTATPEVRAADGIKEYIWDLHGVPAVVAEDQVPSWLSAYPWIQLSEYTDWSEVATWAAGLFSSTNLDAPELKDEIARLRRLNANAERTVLAALEFAQNDIRYLGIEFGPNSYHPTDPVTVLRRRFGDCKDKAFLLCTLLRGLGYEATPVLVATGFRHTLPELLPAPQDFDHVIVRAKADGATYWLDPTRLYQRGPIAQRYRPDYSFGLPVGPGVTELAQIPLSAGGMPETFTTEEFHVGGQKAATRLNVTTTFKGFDAEWIRAILTAEGRERLANGYLNDYAQRYPGVTPTTPLVVEDFTNQDTVTISHAYAISNFWQLSPEKERYSCQFYPLGIHGWITKPSSAVRLMPMGVPFPRRRLVQTKIDLPREFKLSNFATNIADAAAELRIERSHSGPTVWLTYEYRALTNFVAAAQTSEHLDCLDRMENALGYSLTWQNTDGANRGSQFNWPIFLLAIIHGAVFSTGAGLLCQRQCRLPPAPSTGPPPLPASGQGGLGGWLILVGFGLSAGALRLMVNMSHTAGVFSVWKWHSLTSPGSMSYQPAWAPLLTMELLGQISILILDVFVLALFFQKRRIFPRWFMALLGGNAIFVVADQIGLQFLNSPSTAGMDHILATMVPVLIGCGIWIPYMLVSKRVKATFVRQAAESRG